MRKDTIRRIITVFVLIAALSIGLTALLFLFKKKKQTTVPKTNETKLYAVVPMEKSQLIKNDSPANFQLVEDSTFVFLTKQVLRANKNKAYLTISFSDGTGICFPSSSYQNAATYGKIDKEGIITKELEYIKVNGNTITVTAPPNGINELSAKVLQKIPDKYQNDGLSVTLDEGANVGTIEITTMPNEDELESVKEILSVIASDIPSDMTITWTVNDNTTLKSVGANLQ